MDPTQQYPRTAELQLSCDWQDPYHWWSLLTRCKMHDKIYCTVVGESKFEDRRQDMGWFLTRTSSSNSWSHHCLLNMKLPSPLAAEKNPRPDHLVLPENPGLLVRHWWGLMAHANGIAQGSVDYSCYRGFCWTPVWKKGFRKRLHHYFESWRLLRGGLLLTWSLISCLLRRSKNKDLIFMLWLSFGSTKSANWDMYVLHCFSDLEKLQIWKQDHSVYKSLWIWGHWTCFYSQEKQHNLRGKNPTFLAD